MTTKAERILEDAKRFIQVDEQRLLEGEFQATFSFFTTNDPDAPRLMMMPNMGSDNVRGEVAWALRLVSAAIEDLDCIAFSVDTYAHKAQFSEEMREALKGEPTAEDVAKTVTKLDGTPWGQGDMQFAWENDTPDKALITEAYTYQIAYNDGTFAMLSVPYVRDAGTIKFEWDSVQPLVTGEEGGKAGGFFPEAMLKALTETKMVDSAKLHHPEMVELMNAIGLEEWRARLHTMAVAVKMVMKETGWPCMIPAHSEEEAELISDSFKEGPFTEGLNVYNQDDIREIGDLEDQFSQPAVGTPEWLANLQGNVE